MLPDELEYELEEIPVFKLIAATELTKQPAQINYLIEDYLPEKSIVEIFGAAGSGKSFIALDMGFCIANGIDWHGLKTQEGTVVFLAGEGFSGIGQRLRALEIKYGIPANHFFISKQPASLTDDQNAAWVAESIKPHDPVLIVIDTLSRNFGAGDENSTRDMNTFINNIDVHIKMDATVLILHHTGHVEKTRARGSSVLNCAMDCEYSVTKSERLITLANTKMKESEPPLPLAFEMVIQELNWLNDDDEAINSIVLNKTDCKPAKELKARLSARNDAVLTALERAIAKHGIAPTPAIKERFGGFGFSSDRRVVHLDHWRQESYPILDVEPGEREKENKRSAFNRAKETLKKNHVQTMDGYFWKIYN